MVKYTAFKYIFSSLTWFHSVHWPRKSLKSLQDLRIGHIVQVFLQYKVGATPELGPDFREVNAAGAVLTIKGVAHTRGSCCEAARTSDVFVRIVENTVFWRF